MEFEVTFKGDCVEDRDDILVYMKAHYIYSKFIDIENALRERVEKSAITDEEAVFINGLFEEFFIDGLN